MRLALILTFIASIVILLIGRVYYISIHNHLHYEELSKQNYIKRKYTTASRGSIIDRNGKYLATNDVGFSISIPPHLRSVKKFEQVKKYPN